MRFGIVVFISLFFAGTILGQKIKLSPSKAQQLAGEELVVQYANIPPLSDKEFYLLFVFGGEGADFHDSKPIRKLPGGTVKMKPITKVGKFELVVYRYKDFNDTRPQQLARVPFSIVAQAKQVKKPTPKPEKKEEVVVKKSTEDKKTEPETRTVSEEPAVVISTPTNKNETSKGGSNVVNNQISLADSAEMENAAKLAEKILITTFTIMPDNPADTGEKIVLNYVFPEPDSSSYYQVSIARPGENREINIVRADSSAGSISLNPIFEKGIYELKVLQVLKDSAGIDSIVHRQPIVIGSIDKNYAGRYNCWPKKPYVAGTSIPDAPQPDELLKIYTRLTAQKNTVPWLTEEDVCVEVQVIEYFPKTVVTFLSLDTAEMDRIYPAFPVRFVSRVILNDYINKKSSLAEDSRDKYFYFYKNEENEWVYALQPGTQKKFF